MNTGAKFTRINFPVNNVGVGYSTVTVPGAPSTGKVIEVQAVKQSGTGINVSLQVKEQAGPVRLDSGALSPFPLVIVDKARVWKGVLQVAVKVDVGADTNINIELALEY